MRRKTLFVTFVTVVACVPLARSLAHHSRSEFADEAIELEGVLTDVDWRNPHPSFGLRIEQGPNAGQTWFVQVYGAVNTLTRAGVDGGLFEPGQHVRLAGQPSSRRDNYILGTHILLPDNVEAVLGRDFTPRWSQDYVGGVEGWRVDESVLAAAGAEGRGLFRVWSVPSREEVQETWKTYRPFTEAAIAARESWDDNDNPITRCEKPWVPSALVQPLGFEISNNDDTITIRYAFFGASRIINFGNAAPAEDQLRSRMGYSIGKWEGDSLVVQTSRISAPALDARGTLQTEEMVLTERFSLSEDQSRLTYDLTMSDPAVFGEPATVHRTYIAINEPFEPYLCDP